MACSDGIFIVDVSTRSTRSLGSTPQGAYYCPHALALFDDALLVAGNYYSPYSVCGYDTASGTQLWIYKTVHRVGAICMLGQHVLVTVACNLTLVLDCNTGAKIAALQKADQDIFGLGVLEGPSFILS